MNLSIRNRAELMQLGVQRPSTHPIEANEAPRTGVERSIVKYRPLLARIQIRRQQRRAQVRSIRVHRSHLREHPSIPERRMKMPTSLKLLMDKGWPIGARQMTCAMSGETYYKFNGIRQTTIENIAAYLISIPEDKRKDILERLMLHCRGWVMGKITEAYTNAAALIQRKNVARIFTNRAVVCDQAGCIH